MSIDTLKRIVLFVVYILAQATVFGHIHLLGVATPLFYVYFVAKFPKGYPPGGILLWCFCLGLAVDIFANTPGVAAGSLTFIGLLQPLLLTLFAPRDTADGLVPSIRTIGLGKFTSYAVFLVVIYCLVFCALDTLSYFDLTAWSLYAAGSAVFTLVLIMTVESVRR